MFSKEQIIRIRSRKEYIDVLRALAMFFVILGHQVRGDTKYFVSQAL